MNAVEIQGVSQRYGSMTVLHDLNLNLGEGEVLGLFGHNGAGKTTSMKLILGLLAPSEGQVKVLGRAPNDPQVRRQLGYLPENVTFYPQLSGRETLRHFARLKGAALSQVDELLEQVGLAHAADRRVKTYSKGMRQRLGLAQALLGEPKLLLLDEPTVGLDPIATQDLYLLIDRLRQRGTSIILCSHVLPGVEAHINRAAILAKGRLQAVGSLSQLRAEAGLPVRIRASGVSERDSWLQRWTDAGHSARGLSESSLEVVAVNGHKLVLLRQLLGESEPEDIEIHQPSLEDLYRYYMERAGDVRAQEGRV
ncbi:ABC transporter ATP-binding protein [Stutzerimonas kunmingensis]|jgi:Cu-processing system ATP-binding protein|uniref:ABC transporter ATP-binding protein n=2 Tax=Stutzerimonas stutzeri subgroup TaxID=578833 RepID=A0A9X1N5B3_9GAMM|nr:MULTISPECIES: ABC transporter ATP-binding protein [Stutzerimonas stutzeri group]KJS33830.1 MAG: copper ABC transporter ATP-binding protein [Pseudomonas sp. BRH_c35]MBU0920170.1 ABC transporter ATP-binding protein [Gammaproteobacteria bacterium]OHC13622.1 MAG: copper ABC transporter ATP-binding protein [Pseudomonadales bacterium GWC2_63_15]RRU75959.1 ABC transporter ATP-binding protein [Stutzerimonas xanthomarina]TVT70450.1 MAG: ABC transporter ATP-binding protein [Pseudomonas sp.]